MRVRFWTQCYGCRRKLGRRWHRIQGGHRWDWYYTLMANGSRLVTRGPFATLARAQASAERAWPLWQEVIDAWATGETE